MDFNESLGEVLKYQRERLPVSAIHPELRFTRLGAVLREHATEPSDVGELAYQALTSDHSQPLELMPLHLLRDKMQEEPDHPLAKRFKWETLPDRVALDQTLRKSVNDWNAKQVNTNSPLSMHHLLSERMQPTNIMDGVLKVFADAHKSHDVAPMHVSDSARRMREQDNLRWFAEGEDAEYHAERLHNNLSNSTAYGHPSEQYR